MGLTVVKPIVQVRGARVDVVKAVPEYSYVPFPAYRTKSPGDLITQFKALPSAVAVDDLYWWTDCQFVPYDDSQLLTTSGAYHLRHNQSSVRELKIPLGKICRFRLGPPKIKCEIFGKASTFTYPRLQIYPNGSSVAYLGTGDIKILSFESNTVTSKAQNLHFHSYRTCVLSCDGKKFAIMARTGIHTYDVLIYDTEILTIPDCIIDLHKMNPEFKKNRTNTEHPECKWSVDCKCVAASLSTGPLIVLNVKRRSMLCNVFPDVIPDNSLSRETAFDFDPMSFHQLMAVGTSDRFLYIINVETGKILCRTAEVCGSDSIDVVKYSPDGRFVGVALHNCQIQLYHPDDCSLLYRFSMKDHSTELAGWSPGPCPVVIHMNFSMTGQQAVTSTADGMIRVWQLPPNLCLQFLCKMKILSVISQDKVKRLPLPGQIMDYLLTMPTKE